MVLGASPAPTNPNGAGSGYLVAGPSERVLVDCGPGVVGRLRARIAVAELDAVVISHFHADHFIDLIPLRYGILYAGWRPGPPLPVYIAPGGKEYLARLGQALDHTPAFFEAVLGLVEYAPGQEFQVGQLRVCPAAVQHYVPSYALAITVGGRRLAYSADAAPCRALVDTARGADLFLCEAALASAAGDEPIPQRRGHLSAAEAGALAREAGARRLLLTHYATEGAAQRLEAARETFGPRACLAHEGRSYEV